jgi:porphobilinogen synthase
MPAFPVYRARRLRRTEALRRLVRETTLMPSQLVLPLFVRNGRNLRRPIDAMPGVSQTSPDELERDVTSAAEAGIGGVILFGIPDHKDETGSEAWAENGAVQAAVRMLKKNVPGIVVITDVCMCEYTSHGHC